MIRESESMRCDYSSTEIDSPPNQSEVFMLSASIPNCAGVKRLTIGVTRSDGNYASMTFVAENTMSPLIAVAAPPTEREMNEHYLTAHGWQKNDIGGWIDPLTLVEYLFDNAVEVQEGRDLFGESCCACNGVYVIGCECDCHKARCAHGAVADECAACAQAYSEWLETQGGQDPRPAISFYDLYGMDETPLGLAYDGE